MSQDFTDLAGGSLPTRVPAGPTPAERHVKRVGLVLFGLLVIAVGLESFGVEVWPRRAGQWEQIEYRRLPNDAGSCDVFYDRKAGKAAARLVGDECERRGYFKGDKPVSVFVTRDELGYHVCFFVESFSPHDHDGLTAFRQLRRDLERDILTDAPVVIDLCERQVKPGYEARLSVLKRIDD